jgi:hypothetical protein
MLAKRCKRVAVLFGALELYMRDDSKASDGRSGKVGWIILWLLGVPLPILLILFAIRGCT